MLAEGQTFQGHLIAKPLGSRKSIWNYQAKRLASGATVRLTILTADLLPTAKERAAFVRSALPLCHLAQPGLAQLLEVGEADGRVYYVSVFHPGGNLKQLLAKPLHPGQALRLLRALLQALADLHAAGFVHGNVKPGNILLGAEGQPILTDVGVTPLLPLDYSLGIDPYYVSPEQVRGSQPAAASDIYSLGIALYQMLTRTLPFQADSDFRIAMLRLDEPLPVLPKEYRFMQSFLDRLLVLDPQQRGSAAELCEALDGLIEEADGLDMPAVQARESRDAEGLSEEEQSSAPEVDMAARIERTLHEREAQRHQALPAAEVLPVPAEKAGTSFFKVLLLLVLGVLIGGVGGALFHFDLSGSTGKPVPAENRENPQRLRESAADRFLAAGQLEQAKKAYMKEISGNPPSPQPYNNLAGIYAAEGDLEQAQVLLQKALETNPDYLSIYRNIGTVYAAMARDSYGKALQLESAVQPVQLQLLGSSVNVVAAPKKEQAEPAAVAVSGEDYATSLKKPATRMKPAEAKSVQPVVEPQPHPGDETASVVPAEGQAPAPAAVEEKAVSAPEAPAPDIATVSPQQFLQHWASAWSQQDVDAYLGSYAPDYAPSGYPSHSQWAEKRRQRLLAPAFIEVSLEPEDVVEAGSDRVELRLVQNYRSDRYQDRTRKMFVLRSQGQGWVIVAEKSLGRVD